ncbi:MAG: isoprenylcysteine carboxylmethyltransferase family protein [Eubacteriaceae bacterium]|jgi:protein-S-isoprenylcysteine O-methyltransferase Ste14|nr:isoprenylcysteine carboxylmethyltransferase family protein [Eubacteriaceae bacterium]
MPNNKKKLPVFGFGPIYVLTCLLLTIGALALDYYGYLDMGKLTNGKTILFALGVILIIMGIFLWIKSVIFQKIGEEIKKGHLVTTGVYSIVRNPIYSAFILIFTGMLLMSANLYLLILPFVFWAYLTVLMKLTEEKWLKEKFGDEYVEYCREVNRVIPWFRKR